MFDETAWHGASPIDSRKASRTSVSLPIALTTPSQEVLRATLADISTGGCKVRSTYKVASGRFLTIAIPDFTSYSGWVAWANGAEFGLDWSNVIPAGVIQHVLYLAASQPLIKKTWFETLLGKSPPLYLSNHLALRTNKLQDGRS